MVTRNSFAVRSIGSLTIGERDRAFVAIAAAVILPPLGWVLALQVRDRLAASRSDTFLARVGITIGAGLTAVWVIGFLGTLITNFVHCAHFPPGLQRPPR